jgi:hypothetical protein
MILKVQLGIHKISEALGEHKKLSLARGEDPDETPA